MQRTTPRTIDRVIETLRSKHVEEAIKKLNPKVVVLQAGDRAFLHLHLGKEPALRDALLCSAIENQDWLCKLLGSLAKLDGRKLTFTTRSIGAKGQRGCGRHIQIGHVKPAW